MPLFACSKCGCVENTALCRYHLAVRDGQPPLCSGCDPAAPIGFGKLRGWHGEFPQEKPEVNGYVEYTDGFLYHPVREAAWTKRMGLRPKKRTP